MLVLKSFLLNRILKILPNDYFEFKRVRESKTHYQRTVKALTEELCLLEQKLKQRDVTGSSTGNNNVALLTKSESNHASVATASGVKKGKKVFDKKKVRCYNCNKFGHFASECRCKSVRTNDRNSAGHNTVANVVDGAYSFMGKVSYHTVQDKNVWYADNGATDHMTFDDSLFVTYTKFPEQKPAGV